MRRRAHTLAIMFLLGLCTSLCMASAQAQSPQELLNQYISDLQKNPNDTALREKIIKLAQEMKLTPKIPESVDELVGQAKYVFKHAKTQEDYLGAVEAYKKIVNITPWVGDYYYNLGVAQEQAGQPNDAINSFKLYLLASPDAKDAKEVRERIGGLKYAIENAAKGSSPAAIAEKKRQTEEDFIQKLNGVRYVRDWSSSASAGITTLDIRGNKIIMGMICSRGCYGEYSDGAWHYEDETTLNGREFSLDRGGNLYCSIYPKTKGVEKGKISDDGYSITMESCNKTYIYRRER